MRAEGDIFNGRYGITMVMFWVCFSTSVFIYGNYSRDSARLDVLLFGFAFDYISLSFSLERVFAFWSLKNWARLEEIEQDGLAYQLVIVSIPQRLGYLLCISVKRGLGLKASIDLGLSVLGWTFTHLLFRCMYLVGLWSYLAFSACLTFFLGVRIGLELGLVIVRLS